MKKAALIVGTICFITKGFSSCDTSKNKRLPPSILMELSDNNSLYYSEPKSSKSGSSMSYSSEAIFHGYLPVYKNFGMVPVIGYEFSHEKYNSGSIYKSRGFYYGLGIEKRFRISEKSNLALGAQRVFYEERNISKYSSYYFDKYYYSNAWRFRLTASTKIYGRFGLSSSLNFVAYPRSSPEYYFPFGSFRDIRFTFGITYNFKRSLTR